MGKQASAVAEETSGKPGAKAERKLSVREDLVMSHAGKNQKLIRQLTKRLAPDGFQQKTEQGLTTEFVDTVERPLFISDYPFEQGHDIFDCFFNLDTNQWSKFDLGKDLNRMQINYQETIPSMRLVQNVHIPTYDSIRYDYVMELLLTTQKPVLVFGEGASGKSSLVKDMLFAQSLQFAQSYFVEHLTCCHYTSALALKNGVERNLEVKRQEVAEDKDEMGKTMNSVMREVAADSGHLKPPGDNHKLVVYFEDLHMTRFDKYNDVPGLEVMRDLITTKEWYSTARKSQRVIDDTSVIACIDTRAEQYERLPRRLLYCFALIGMEGYSSDTMVHVMTQLFEIQSADWPSQITGLIPRLARAVDALYRSCFQYLKPTPLKVHYTFNYRECFRMVTSFCKIEGNYLKTEANLVKLFYHEAVRQYGDKILMRHDLAWFSSTLEKLVWDTFDLMPYKEMDAKTTTNQEGEDGQDAPEEEVRLADDHS